MVQRKGMKNKPKNQGTRRAVDGTKLNAQLDSINLRIVHVTADGNCLFRAIADQLEGNEEEHSKYRDMVVNYIEAHRDDYEPFLEDDVPFGEYCKGMRELGTWAGHMELQAISLVTHTNICIHQLSLPRWHIHNFKATEAQCIHLSYHNDEHYNSVRRKDDCGQGSAELIVLEKSQLMDENMGKSRIAHKSRTVKSFCNHELAVHKESSYMPKRSDNNVENDDHRTEPLEDILDNGAKNDGNTKTDVKSEFMKDNAKEKALNNNASQQGQKVARNKVCPCGSKKKYKACCGAVTPSNRIITNSTAMSNKVRKEKLRSSKTATKATSEPSPVKDSLDMGYLCI